MCEKRGNEKMKKWILHRFLALYKNKSLQRKQIKPSCQAQKNKTVAKNNIASRCYFCIRARKPQAYDK